jgi:hypothetical protein
MEQFDFKLDEPDLTSSEIKQTMDFDALVSNSAAGSKSWYETWWFITGMSVIGISLIGLIAFQFINGDEPLEEEENLTVLSKKTPDLNTDAYWESNIDSKSITINGAVPIDNGWNLSATELEGNETTIFYSKSADQISEFTDEKLKEGELLKIDSKNEVEVNLTREINDQEGYHMHTYDKDKDEWNQVDERIKVITEEKAISRPKKKTQPAVQKFVTNRVGFQIDIDKNEFPELAQFENIIFMAGLEHESVEKVTWDMITPVKMSDNQYQLKLQKFDSVLFVPVIPTLSPEDYAKQVPQESEEEIHIEKSKSVNVMVKTKEWTVISKDEIIVKEEL